VNELKLGIFDKKDNLKNMISKKLGISVKDILDYKIFKESIDARRSKVKMIYTVDVRLKDERKIIKKGKFKESPNYEYKHIETKLNKEVRPIIIGSGPAGLFSALILSQNGYKPIIIEQGEKVNERIESIEKFWKEGILNENSNVQFGEGGAGTFSDGKLTTRIKDPRCRKVLEEFIELDAPKEIIYKNNPHIGTDNLRKIIIKMRKKIESLGGEFKFNSKVTNLIIKDNSVKGVEINDKIELLSDIVVLAIGHSSRCLFEKLESLNVKIESKPFAIGVRIEHPQKMIDLNQYGNINLSDKLGAADYKLTYNSNNRGVYTFCMCPGGSVVASSSEKNTVVTNGMSEYKRDKKNGNSAILVTVKPEDFDSDLPLAGMYFQRELEQNAFKLGGENYFAPVTLLSNYLYNEDSEIKDRKIEPTYMPGVKFVDFNELLPSFINDVLKEAIRYFDKRINGFARKDAILTGVETRSSSPIRIIRDSNTLQSENIVGLFPCGEGAGYAGGIMSSAVDGIKVAEEIMKCDMKINKISSKK
ncbi:MAG: hypothetical protein U9N10_09980, partial [Bacillota bacterium]|nr:hypothetical protein [Bacillota bacterium]